MQYIVVFQPKQFAEGKPDDFAEVEQAEQVHAKALYKLGVAQQIWSIQTERKGAIGMFEAPSQQELQKTIESFPMVQNKYAEPTVFPLGPFAAFAQ